MMLMVRRQTCWQVMQALPGEVMENTLRQCTAQQASQREGCLLTL